jgi:tRNA pseudouridine55 synthase
MLCGFLNLHKPSGLSSHDCVAKVRRILQLQRVGHGGTLDPLASGVLPIAVGSATRLLQYLPTDKVYAATIRLGLQTSTDDLEGDVLQIRDVSPLTRSQLWDALQPFLGKIQQVPPAYSAIQVQGQRLYHLARQGKTVDVPMREVEIFQIDLLDWQPDVAELTVRIACGSGTYIRAIARDFGTALGCGGTLAQLIRLQSCGLDLQHSLTLEDLTTKVMQHHPVLTEPARALQHLPLCPLAPEKAQRWCLGQTVAVETTGEVIVRVEDFNQTCLGIGQLSNGYCHPKVVLTPANGKDFSPEKRCEQEKSL